MIALVDYGMGNLRSVAKALEACGGRVKITSSPRDLKKAKKILLPGVGAFPDAVRELKKKRLWDALIEEASENKHLMGICLGFQLLFSSSDEGGKRTKGLNLIPGEVKKFPLASLPRQGYKVPHMGWNEMKFRKKSRLLTGLKSGSYFYFVHSYYPVPEDPSVVLGETLYGRPFASAIEKNRLYGFQFHPEKSQGAGLRILKNFIQLI
jgi:glutamine amidotransferase